MKSLNIAILAGLMLSTTIPMFAAQLVEPVVVETPITNAPAPIDVEAAKAVAPLIAVSQVRYAPTAPRNWATYAGNAFRAIQSNRPLQIVAGSFATAALAAGFWTRNRIKNDVIALRAIRTAAIKKQPVNLNLVQKLSTNIFTATTTKEQRTLLRNLITTYNSSLESEMPTAAIMSPQDSDKELKAVDAAEHAEVTFHAEDNSSEIQTLRTTGRLHFQTDAERQHAAALVTSANQHKESTQVNLVEFVDGLLGTRKCPSAVCDKSCTKYNSLNGISAMKNALNFGFHAAYIPAMYFSGR